MTATTAIPLAVLTGFARNFGTKIWKNVIYRLATLNVNGRITYFVSIPNNFWFDLNVRN